MTGRHNNPKDKEKDRKRRTKKSEPAQGADDGGTGGPNIKREQPPSPNVVKKILKAENDEARTLKTVFKSNPDSQMKDFIKKASSTGQQKPTPAKPALKTPAENHPPAVAQELLETDDDVADNLGRLFKASKSFKSV